MMDSQELYTQNALKVTTPQEQALIKSRLNQYTKYKNTNNLGLLQGGNK